MNKSNPKQYEVSFHILTPVHVGSGDEIDPFSYIIRDGHLHIINLIDWIADYPEKEELLSLMEKDSFSAIRTFIAKNYTTGSYDKVSIPVDSSKLFEDYEKAIKLQNAANQVLVNSMTRNEIDGYAYIPGSSIKGAIRTAIANRFVKQAGVKSADGQRRNWETKIFGQIKDDPLRYLRLSDISLKEHGTCIVEAKEYTNNKDKSLTPKGSKECAVSLCRNLEPIKYNTRLTLEPENIMQLKIFNTKIDVNFLIESLNSFYVPKYIEEYKTFYKDVSEEVEDAIAPASLAVACLKPNEALIRVGQHSHVECMTLDNVRSPRVPRGKNWGTTRTLANGIYPFGWCKLEFNGIPSNEVDKNKHKAAILKNMPFTANDLELRIQKLKEQKEKEKKQQEKEELDRQEREKQRSIEEEKKRDFEAMTTEEQLLLKFSNNAVSDNEGNDIFNNIQNYASDYRKRIAEALKNYWQEKKQWSKNDVSKKKWKTVRERNEIVEGIIAS
ncbi:MAG: type III-A CRISPR-associated RAMP protein Csm5 [Desulfamplus sp.]|nr:type III-A CRISPR-associated RAMP protein Csm5 [Desulfamplus sp.]